MDFDAASRFVRISFEAFEEREEYRMLWEDRMSAKGTAF